MTSLLGSAWRSLFPSLCGLCQPRRIYRLINVFKTNDSELSMALSMFSRTSVHQWHVTIEEQLSCQQCFFVAAHRLQQWRKMQCFKKILSPTEAATAMSAESTWTKCSQWMATGSSSSAEGLQSSRRQMHSWRWSCARFSVHRLVHMWWQ